eukprot:3167399-Rhodomonas_salina.1
MEITVVTVWMVISMTDTLIVYRKPLLDTQSQLLDTGPLAITVPGSEKLGPDTGQHVNSTSSSHKAVRLCKLLCMIHISGK